MAEPENSSFPQEEGSKQMVLKGRSQPRLLCSFSFQSRQPLSRVRSQVCSLEEKDVQGDRNEERLKQPVLGGKKG